MITITHDEGKQLVRIARDTVESLFQLKELFLEPSRRAGVEAGVFVTIHGCSTNGNSLRGCIGFPFPRGDFYSSLAEAAIAAATQDPRFRPISKNELDKIIFEVSVLSRPEPITVGKPDDYLDKVKIGVDGLVFSWGKYSSLLLPQVALEFGWTVDEYLSNLSCKAGLTPDMWMADGAKIYKFACLVYKELQPRGEICRVTISGI
jgi:uncharacterized protein (TIGR00296 family)